MRVTGVKTFTLLLLMSAGITTCGRDTNSDKPRIPFPVNFPPPTDNPGDDDDDDGSTEPPPTEEPGNDCVYGQGYWKNHSDTWPAESLVIADERYNQEELLALFSSPTHGDKSLILARQYVAALLNVANGASAAAMASEVLAASEQWMTVCKDEDGRLPYGISQKRRDDSETYSCSKSAKHLAGLLDLYNGGKLGTPPCGRKDGDDDDSDDDDD